MGKKKYYLLLLTATTALQFILGCKSQQELLYSTYVEKHLRSTSNKHFESRNIAISTNTGYLRIDSLYGNKRKFWLRGTATYIDQPLPGACFYSVQLRGRTYKKLNLLGCTNEFGKVEFNSKILDDTIRFLFVVQTPQDSSFTKVIELESVRMLEKKP